MNINKTIIQYGKWEKEISYLRSLAHKFNLDEGIKWKNYCYMIDGKNIFILSSFKEYFTVNFFNGSLINDSHKILTSHGNNQQASRILKFHSLKEAMANESIILDYMNQAINNHNAGLKIEKRSPSVNYCEPIITIFKSNESLKNAFNLLTPGRQRAYMMFFCSPKNEETKIRRINKYIEKIMEGKGMND